MRLSTGCQWRSTAPVRSNTTCSESDRQWSMPRRQRISRGSMRWVVTGMHVKSEINRYVAIRDRS